MYMRASSGSRGLLSSEGNALNMMSSKNEMIGMNLETLLENQNESLSQDFIGNMGSGVEGDNIGLDAFNSLRDLETSNAFTREKDFSAE